MLKLLLKVVIGIAALDCANAMMHKLVAGAVVRICIGFFYEFCASSRAVAGVEDCVMKGTADDGLGFAPRAVSRICLRVNGGLEAMSGTVATVVGGLCGCCCDMAASGDQSLVGMGTDVGLDIVPWTGDKVAIVIGPRLL